MRKTIFTLFLSILPLTCFAKVLEVVNDSNVYMSFQFGYACMDIVPDRFELLPNQSKQVNLNINMENKDRCPAGNLPTLIFTGLASKYPGMNSSLHTKLTFEQITRRFLADGSVNKTTGHYSHFIATSVTLTPLILISK